MSRRFLPSPRFGWVSNLVRGVTGFGKPRLVAVKLGGKDDVTNSHVAWEDAGNVPMLPSMIADGGRHIVLLDLARVGTGRGPETWTACAGLVRRHPGLVVYVGGGIRGWDDIRRLEAAGADGVLLASALHDGTFWPMANEITFPFLSGP